MRLLAFPPAITHELTWRDLCRAGAFAARELVVATTFKDGVARRGFRLGAGEERLVEAHRAGALRPIAFACGGPYFGGLTAPAAPDESIVFSDEELSADWNDYAFELNGRSHVAALYSPWQCLLAQDVFEGGRIDLPLSAVADEHALSDRGRAQLRGLAQTQQARWSELDDAWRGLLQVLMRLQNRYLPDVTGGPAFIFDPDLGADVLAPGGDLATFHPAVVFEREFGEDRAGLAEAYEFLMERAISLDPVDGLTLLRRARPRAFHLRWEGATRLAQDHFDAADLLRRFLRDVDGTQPPQPARVPLDGRQRERAELYRRGPASSWSGPEVVAALQEADLYPHGVHVVHEGQTDRLMIETVIGALFGHAMLDEVAFTDLKGAGSSEMIPDLVGSLGGYARRVVVIIDNEAKALTYVNALVESGALPAEDVLLFATSNEEENASDQELVDIANGLAARADGQLSLSGEDLRRFHETRITRAQEHNQEIPGLANSLQLLVKKTTKGRWRLRKRQLASELAERIAEEMQTVPEEHWTRPLAVFILHRVIPPLNRPRPAGPS
jgi:hypothetical protein